MGIEPTYRLPQTAHRIYNPAVRAFIRFLGDAD